MQILLKSLTLTNFKGIKNLKVCFKNNTTISGDNGTGKTTIFDAFTWLLFGKDSGDNKDFNIKTLDGNNEPLHKLDHEVAGTIEQDGYKHTLRRVYREKWVKKRGEETTELTGHETLYYYNDIPLSQKEYITKVDSILNEKWAKLITNPLYFNQLKWQDRRKTLEEIAGEINDTDIASGNKEFETLLGSLGNTSLIEYKKQIVARKKKLKEDLESIPTRIDEANRNMPEVENFAALEKAIAALEKEISGIDEQIADKSLAHQSHLERISIQRNNKFELERKLQIELQNMTRENDNKLAGVDNKIVAHNRSINSLKLSLGNLPNEIKLREKLINDLETANQELRSKWESINAETLVVDESCLSCPSCKQVLPEGKQEEIRNQLSDNFRRDQMKRLDAISGDGVANNKIITDHKTAIEKYQTEKAEKGVQLAHLETELQRFISEEKELQENQITDTSEAINLRSQIAAFVIDEAPLVDNSELKARKHDINIRINLKRAKLVKKEQIDNINGRIDELQKAERELAQQLAELERSEFIMERFNKAKIEAIEHRINSKFTLVKFRMFDQQLNGGEAECCDCMVNGVPYADVNTAGKINAGLDIINAISKHFEMHAPIFIDNRESINELIPCDSQIVNLKVSNDLEIVIK